MSFESMLWHRAELWRPTETRGPDAEVVPSFVLVVDPVGFNAEPFVLDRKLRDHGPGEQTFGDRKWGLRRDTAARKFDVLNVVEGINAPCRLRVLDSFAAGTAGEVHHYECVTEAWEGLLPPDTEEASS